LLLLIHPDEDLLNERSSHMFVKSRFNQHSRFGNVDGAYAQLLNRLWELRIPARYLPREFNLSVPEADSLLQTAKAMRQEAEARLPSRFRNSPPG
jgi:hypothetical protein